MNSQSLDQMIARNKSNKTYVQKRRKTIRKQTWTPRDHQKQSRRNRLNNTNRDNIKNRSRTIHSHPTRNPRTNTSVRGNNRIRPSSSQRRDHNPNRKQYFSSDLTGSQNKRGQQDTTKRGQSRITRGRLPTLRQRRLSVDRKDTRPNNLNRLASLRSNYQRKRGINSNRLVQQKDRRSIHQNNRKSVQQKDKRLRPIKVSGLDLKINNQELFELFSEIGPLIKCNISYDSLGRSKGTAIIKYENMKDAQSAIKKYNYAELDNHKLRLEFVKSKVTKTIQK